jgi:hypothetical protein
VARRRAILGLLGASCLLLAGCGDSRATVPSLSQPAAPRGFSTLGYPRAGIALVRPSNWPVLAEQAPMVSLFSSGDAVVALWRYPRSTPPPSGSTALGQARDALVSAARARDPGLRLIRSAILQIDHVSAIELDAFERIGSGQRRVRSLHLYVPGAEIVLEEYAPAAIFHAVDHAVFSPVKRSLRLIPVTSA